MPENILQYESTIWKTADLLRGCGIKESEWPSYMMPFFALAMIESQLSRKLGELAAEIGVDYFAVSPTCTHLGCQVEQGAAGLPFTPQRIRTQTYPALR